MQITPKPITIRELAEDYRNCDEEGVVGYSGRLDIRPKYQREFVYKDEQRNAVIKTVMRGLPLNVMYWCQTDAETFEVMDGQQRTISICEYVEGNFSVKDESGNDCFFFNLPADKKKQILDYELLVYVCDGTDSEKLDWFRTINIAGERLTDQELRNAVYAGPWVSDAKRFFSKSGCPAFEVARDYLKGTSIRQEYLETAISWAVDVKEKEKQGGENIKETSTRKEEGSGTIEGYMAAHQHDSSAQALWSYFRTVIDWVQATFPKYRKEMKGIEWGLLYNKYGASAWNAAALEKRVSKLMADEDVTRKSGIYPYVLGEPEKVLSVRPFGPREKREAYERQDGECRMCGEKFDISEMEADHIKPWSQGGKTISENCQMLCKACNRTKGAK